MAKKRKKVSRKVVTKKSADVTAKSNTSCVGCCCKWTTKDWTLLVLSEASLYGFLWYLLSVLDASGNLAWVSLVLWILLNVSVVACPVIRKHFI